MKTISFAEVMITIELKHVWCGGW